jgi:hypothetical protein
MAAMKPTLYIETSVISYYTAGISRDLVVAGHQQTTQEWWQTVLPQLDPHVSVSVMEEIAGGDPRQAERRLAVVEGMKVLSAPRAAGELADAYARALEIPAESYPDAVHLALASWHGMDYLVSWNCRHIASERVRRALGAVNSKRGIPVPGICTPEQLMEL